MRLQDVNVQKIPIHTTLYDIVEAVSDTIEPGEEQLIGSVVQQMVSDCHAKFEGFQE